MADAALRPLLGSINRTPFVPDPAGATNEAIHASVVQRLAVQPGNWLKSLAHIDPSAKAVPLDIVEQQLRWGQTTAPAATPMPKLFDLALRH